MALLGWLLELLPLLAAGLGVEALAGRKREEIDERYDELLGIVTV